MNKFEIKVSKVDYYTWKVGAILLVFLLLFVLFISNNGGTDKKDREFCYLYASERTAYKTWTQHDYPLLREMNKEAQEYYNITYDFNPTSTKKMLFVMGDGRLSSYSFNPETKKPITANCIYEGFVQEGSIRINFEVTKEINIDELKQWREQYE